MTTTVEPVTCSTRIIPASYGQRPDAANALSGLIDAFDAERARIEKPECGQPAQFVGNGYGYSTFICPDGHKTYVLDDGSEADES